MSSMDKRRPIEQVRQRKRNGGKWCAPDKRLAIMFRDGCQCVYCGATVEDGTSLTLDHIIPWILYGSNEPDNLVCACLSCNSRRQESNIELFLADCGYTETYIEKILSHIQQTTQKDISMCRQIAKELLKNRSITAFTGKR